jgi:2-phosphoglycerate kinase
VEHFADIRRIQKYIVGRAVEQGVPVVDNASLDENLSAVLGTILQRVEDYGEHADG